MQSSFYFLSPVEVVKVTADNLQEVAEWCGGKVIPIESKKRPGEMDYYVWVPVPEGGKYLSDAYPGMHVTKRIVITNKNELRITWAVMRNDYFSRNYFDSPLDATNATWEREISERHARIHLRNKIMKAVTKVSPGDIAHATGLGTEVVGKVSENQTIFNQVAAEQQASV